MIFVPFFVSLVLCLGLISCEPYPSEGIPINSSDESGNEGGSKLYYLDYYHVQELSSIYVPNEDDISLDDLVAELEERLPSVGPVYCHFLRDMIVRGSTEAFKGLYSVVLFHEADDYDVLLLAECANHDRSEILEFMINREDFDEVRFVARLWSLIKHFEDPVSCVKVVSLVAAHKEDIALIQDQIYTGLLSALIQNKRADDYAFEQATKKLMELGANMNEEISSFFENLHLNELDH